MGVFLSHFNMEPIIYGLIIILGVIVVLVKIVTLNISGAILDITIFYAVFKMHGGTLQGGMAAAVAALIGGMIIGPILRAFIR
jgi:hypothetical protein